MSRLPTAAEDAAWTPYGDGSEESIVHLAPESEQQVLGSLLLLPEVLLLLEPLLELLPP